MSTSRNNSRRGATLVEVLTVIAVVGVLVGLFLPAAQGVRGAAARLDCQNRLRQIGLGLHAHEATFGALPPGQDWYFTGDGGKSLQSLSWLAKILPFIEQERLLIDARRALSIDPVPWHNPPHSGLSQVIRTYTCPLDGRVSDPQTGPDGIRAAYTSYVGVRGEISLRENGVLPLAHSVRLTDVRDGTSSTLMVGERPPSARLDSGWWYANHLDVHAYDNLLYAETLLGPFDCAPLPDPTFRFGPGRFDNQCDMYHFWSPHRGGANFVFADGSVRFLAYSVSPLMRSLASRNGGEVVTVD